MWFVSMLHCWAAPMQRQRYGKNSKKRVVMGVKKLRPLPFGKRPDFNV